LPICNLNTVFYKYFSMKKSINKSNFIELLAAANGFSKAQSAKFVDSFFAVLAKELAAGKDVLLTGILSMKLTTQKPRVGHNPKTGKQIQIPEKPVLKCKVGKTFLAEVLSLLEGK
jgi:nucleoid DNA-binding protein